MIYLDVDTALSGVPVNTVPLTDDSDFKSLEESVAYNASGLELIWHFITPSGSYTTTVVTPTSGGTYDWAHQDGAMYTIEIPASGGASINNDTEGFGWFTGKATGVLPWRGPTICFRAAGLNNLLIENAFSTTRGLAGTALPDAAAGAVSGVPVLDSNQRAAADAKAIDGSTTAATNAKNFWVGAILHTGTANAGAPGSVTLASAASSVDDFYNGAVITIISGAGAGQSRQITDYTGSSRVATVDTNWVTNPDNTSVYQVIGRIV